MATGKEIKVKDLLHKKAELERTIFNHVDELVDGFVREIGIAVYGVEIHLEKSPAIGSVPKISVGGVRVGLEL